MNRRQFAKVMGLTSFGMLGGDVLILVKGWMAGKPAYPIREVASVGEIPVGGVKLFRYPGASDPCILVRSGENEYAAFSRKCTHVSCLVDYARDTDRLECPCHDGYFSVRDGSVLEGPPERPLPRVILERREGRLVAVGMDS